MHEFMKPGLDTCFFKLNNNFEVIMSQFFKIFQTHLLTEAINPLKEFRKREKKREKKERKKMCVCLREGENGAREKRRDRESVCVRVRRE